MNGFLSNILILVPCSSSCFESGLNFMANSTATIFCPHVSDFDIGNTFSILFCSLQVSLELVYVYLQEGHERPPNALLTPDGLLQILHSGMAPIPRRLLLIGPLAVPSSSLIGPHLGSGLKLGTWG